MGKWLIKHEVVCVYKESLMRTHISWINNNVKILVHVESVYLHNYIQIEINNAKQLNYMFIILGTCIICKGKTNKKYYTLSNKMWVELGYAKFLESVGMKWSVSETCGLVFGIF